MSKTKNSGRIDFESGELVKSELLKLKEQTGLSINTLCTVALIRQYGLTDESNKYSSIRPQKLKK